MQNKEQAWIESLRESLEKAKIELSKSNYLAESGGNAGIRKMHENKANWLHLVVYLAELGLEAEQLFVVQDKSNTEQQANAELKETSTDFNIVEDLKIENKKLEDQYNELKHAYDTEVAYRDELVLRAFIEWSTEVVAKAHRNSLFNGSILVCPLDLLDKTLIDAAGE